MIWDTQHDGLILCPVGTASIRKGNALHLPMRDESVDLIVTSPPYFALRSYTDGGEHYDGQIGSEPTPQAFLEALWTVTAECRRVLKPSGSMWVNLGDKYSGVNPGSYRRHTQPLDGGQGYHEAVAESEAKADHRPDFGGVPAKSLMGLPWRYAIGCIDDLDLILRAEVIWSKPNGLPESVTDRVRRSHEQWFHFTKEPRYFAAVDEVREPQVDPERGRSGLGKLPGSVWTIASEPLKVPDWLGVDHFAAYPQEWPRRIILGWSPSGICVECGEGRRPVVAKELEPLGPNGDGRNRRRANIISGGDYPTERGREAATITGYACACPNTDAPTRPAVVLDPFGGTGTTAMVARALGRYGVHLDLSADYLRLARWRVWESGHEYKTHARSWAKANGAMVDGKPKVPAAIKRQIEAEMKERAIAGLAMEKAQWDAVKAYV